MSRNIYEHSNTAAFYALAWISFAISFIGTALGLYFLEVDLAAKGFFAISYLFSVSSCFTVAKVVRDRQEEQRVINRIENAKTQKLINDYTDPVAAS